MQWKIATWQIIAAKLTTFKVITKNKILVNDFGNIKTNNQTVK